MRTAGVRGAIRAIVSPAFILTGITFADDPVRGACARTALAADWVCGGHVHPALLQVLLDSGLGMLAMTAMAPDEVSISGAMSTTFGTGTAVAGAELTCSGRILRDRDGLLVAYGDVVDDAGTVFVHGHARYHTLFHREMDFEALSDRGVYGSDLDEVISLVVDEQSPERVVSTWVADPRTANRHGRMHGGFVAALSQAAAAEVADRAGRADLLEHTHQYVRPVPAERGRRVRCEAVVERSGRQLITIASRLTDEMGVLLGTSTSTFATTPAGMA